MDFFFQILKIFRKRSASVDRRLLIYTGGSLYTWTFDFYKIVGVIFGSGYILEIFKLNKKHVKKNFNIFYVILNYTYFILALN